MLKNTKSLSKNRSIGKIILSTFLLIYAALVLYPYIFALISSFRNIGDFSDAIFSFSKPTLENYKKMFSEFYYPVTMKDGSTGFYYYSGLMMNSFLYSVGGAICAAIVPCCTAYCVAKFDFFFSKIIMAVVYICMTIPIVGSQVSEIQMANFIGVYDKIPGMWFLKASFLGMNFLIFHAAFKSIPEDYAEAAYMDGAGNFSIYFKIMFPLVTNILFIIFILQFVGLWSDYTTPLYFLPSYPTLSLALLNFSESSNTNATMQMAACVIISLPSLILFACFNDKFASNLKLGGIKG